MQIAKWAGQSPIPNPPQKSPREELVQIPIDEALKVQATVHVREGNRGKWQWRYALNGLTWRSDTIWVPNPQGAWGRHAAIVAACQAVWNEISDREEGTRNPNEARRLRMAAGEVHRFMDDGCEVKIERKGITKARKSEGPKMPVCAEDCSGCATAATCQGRGSYPPNLVHAKAQGRKAAKSASSAVPSLPRLPEAKADPIGGNGEASGSDAAKWIHENVCPKGRTERRSTNGSAADVRSPGGTGKKAGDGHQGEIRNPKSETRNKSEIQNPKSKIAGTALVPATPANLPLGDGPALSPSERKDLARLETLIDRGVRASFAAGIALKEIQERKLYREHFATFEDYCREKLGSSRSDAYRQIQAATLHEVAEKVIEKNSLVVTESHFRPLSKLDDDQVRAVFAAVAKRVKPGADGRRRPTMELVAETAREYATPPEEKHEARNPKSETNPKSEIQNPKSADLSGPANSDGEGRAGGQDEELGGRREEEEKTTAPPVPSRKQARQVVTRSFGGEARRKFWYELNGIEAAVIACANEFAHSIWRDEMRAMLRDLLAQFDAASDYVP
jgi:hypothetical protein